MAEPDDHGGRRIRVEDVGGIPPGQGRCFVADGGEIAVFRQRDGRVFATQNRCPHRNGPLAEGLVGGCKVICPMHGHVFDLETGQGGTEDESVEVFRVAERDGGLSVELPAAASGKAGRK